MIKRTGNGKWRNFANPPNQGGNKPFYKGARWKAFRDEMWQRNGGNICRGQWHKGDRHVQKVHLDHVREIEDGGAEYDAANCQFLCPTCHNQKTAAAAARRRVLAHLR